VDVNDAILWAKANAAEFGLNKEKLALGGASSGGQMAALLAYTADTSLFKNKPDDDTRVNALIDLDGVLDFTTPLAVKFENAAGPTSAAGLWLGGSLEQVPEIWKEASAAKHISAKSPPTLIISSGIERFTAGREDVVAALNGFNIRNQYFAFEGAPHDIWLFEPYLSQIVQKTDSFLKGNK
jgi:acetyl esterase